jgi:hypothetical protein
MYGVPTLDQVVAACRDPGVFRLKHDLLGTNLGKKAKLPGYFWGTSDCSPSIIHARSAAAHRLSPYIQITMAAGGVEVVRRDEEERPPAQDGHAGDGSREAERERFRHLLVDANRR